MADAKGTVSSFTVDRLAYSPSPPIVFAVVDFDGGGRLPVELTDVDEDEVRVGARVEMTFRRLFTAAGIHQYFWNAPLDDRGRRGGDRWGGAPASEHAEPPWDGVDCDSTAPGKESTPHYDTAARR